MAHNVFVVMCNTDTTEGKGRMVPIAAFTSLTSAKTLADSLEPYGRPGSFNRVDTLKVWDSIKEYDEMNDEAIKKRALAKLTVEERKVLGYE